MEITMFWLIVTPLVVELSLITALKAIVLDVAMPETVLDRNMVNVIKTHVTIVEHLHLSQSSIQIQR